MSSVSLINGHIDDDLPRMTPQEAIEFIMTEAEIIKALEEEIHLAEYVDSDYCNNTEVSLIKSALDLINRQKAEIERLKKDRDGWRDTAYAEASNAENLSNKIIKEFAERLKRQKHECGCNYRKKPVYAVTEDKIDNLVKEMAGGTE